MKMYGCKRFVFTKYHIIDNHFAISLEVSDCVWNLRQRDITAYNGCTIKYFSVSSFAVCDTMTRCLNRRVDQTWNRSRRQASTRVSRALQFN